LDKVPQEVAAQFILQPQYEYAYNFQDICEGVITNALQSSKL